MRVIAVLQSLVGDCHGATDAFGHVLPGHLYMDAAGMRAFRPVDGEEALHLGQDAVEGPCLVAAVRFDDIAVHRVAAPHHRVPFGLYCAHEAREAVFDLVVAEAADERDAPRLARGVERVEQLEHRVGLEARPAFHAERIADAAAEFDMRAAFEAGAVADPDHVGAGVVPVARQAVAAGQRLFVGQQQRLVAGVEAGALQLRQRLGIDPAGFHEVERLADPVGDVGELVRPGAAAHEIERPLVHLAQVRIAAGGEGAQQVERSGGLRIGAHHALRIVGPTARFEIDAVDVVAEVARQRHIALCLGVRAARLGKLACHAADLHHRLLAGKGHDDRHLKQHAESVADIVGMELGEAFGAVSALQQEGLALAPLRRGPPSARAPRPAKTSGGCVSSEVVAASRAAGSG